MSWRQVLGILYGHVLFARSTAVWSLENDKAPSLETIRDDILKKAEEQGLNHIQNDQQQNVFWETPKLLFVLQNISIIHPLLRSFKNKIPLSLRHPSNLKGKSDAEYVTSYYFSHSVFGLETKRISIDIYLSESHRWVTENSYYPVSVYLWMVFGTIFWGILMLFPSLPLLLEKIDLFGSIGLIPKYTISIESFITPSIPLLAGIFLFPYIVMIFLLLITPNEIIVKESVTAYDSNMYNIGIPFLISAWVGVGYAFVSIFVQSDPTMVYLYSLISASIVLLASWRIFTFPIRWRKNKKYGIIRNIPESTKAVLAFQFLLLFCILIYASITRSFKFGIQYPFFNAWEFFALGAPDDLLIIMPVGVIICIYGYIYERSDTTKISDTTNQIHNNRSKLTPVAPVTSFFQSIFILFFSFDILYDLIVYDSSYRLRVIDTVYSLRLIGVNNIPYLYIFSVFLFIVFLSYIVIIYKQIRQFNPISNDINAEPLHNQMLASIEADVYLRTDGGPSTAGNGMIFLSKKAYDGLEDDELFALLAHEEAHASVYNDGIIAEYAPLFATLLLTTQSVLLFGLQYRYREMRADAHAVQRLQDTGRDPNALISLLKKMSESDSLIHMRTRGQATGTPPLGSFSDTLPKTEIRTNSFIGRIQHFFQRLSTTIDLFTGSFAVTEIHPPVSERITYIKQQISEDDPDSNVRNQM